MNMKKLTPKQERFVDKYLVDLNATQAAIRAGYSAKTARAIGCENPGYILFLGCEIFSCESVWPC